MLVRRYAVGLLIVVVACRDAPRQPSTAYRDGGIPDRDTAIEVVLHGDLASHHPLPATYGPALVDAWAAAYATTDLTERERHIRDVDAALVAAGLGYRVDLEYTLDGGFGLGVEAFDVDRVVIVDIEGTKYPITEVREIKRAAVRPLGLSNGGPGKVYADRITENMLLELRELGSNRPRRTTHGTDASRAFRTALAPRIHEAWRGFLGADADAAVKIGTLLDERNDDTAQLFIPLDHASPRVIEIDRELRRLDAPRILARLSAAFMASAARHEARHMADEKVMPREVRIDDRMMTFATEIGMSVEHPSFRVADAAWREISAYLDQLATADDGTLYALWWHITASIFDDPAPPEAWCAIFIVSRIEQALTGDLDQFASDGVIDVPRFTAVVVSLGQRTPGELRGAAARVRRGYFSP